MKKFSAGRRAPRVRPERFVRGQQRVKNKCQAQGLFNDELFGGPLECSGDIALVDPMGAWGHFTSLCSSCADVVERDLKQIHADRVSLGPLTSTPNTEALESDFYKTNIEQPLLEKQKEERAKRNSDIRDKKDEKIWSQEFGGNSGSNNGPVL